MGVVIAVDGPAAAGKGTLSRALGQALGLAVLDTGLLYRAVARTVMLSGIDPENAADCTSVARGLEVGWTKREDLRGEEVGRVASKVAAHPGVRAALLEFQQDFARSPGGGANGAVLDGRDIGTVVCPDADLKIFLIADPAARARRRVAEGPGAGSVEEIQASITERDTREMSRAVAPMRPSDDAVIIDTSTMSAHEVFEAAMTAFTARRVPTAAAP